MITFEEIINNSSIVVKNDIELIISLIGDKNVSVKSSFDPATKKVKLKELKKKTDVKEKLKKLIERKHVSFSSIVYEDKKFFTDLFEFNDFIKSTSISKFKDSPFYRDYDEMLDKNSVFFKLENYPRSVDIWELLISPTKLDFKNIFKQLMVCLKDPEFSKISKLLMLKNILKKNSSNVESIDDSTNPSLILIIYIRNKFDENHPNHVYTYLKQICNFICLNSCDKKRLIDDSDGDKKLNSLFIKKRGCIISVRNGGDQLRSHELLCETKLYFDGVNSYKRIGVLNIFMTLSFYKELFSNPLTIDFKMEKYNDFVKKTKGDKYVMVYLGDILIKILTKIPLSEDLQKMNKSVIIDGKCNKFFEKLKYSQDFDKDLKELSIYLSSN